MPPDRTYFSILRYRNQTIFFLALDKLDITMCKQLIRNILLHTQNDHTLATSVTYRRGNLSLETSVSKKSTRFNHLDSDEQANTQDDNSDTDTDN